MDFFVNKHETPAERQVKTLLVDDGIQVLSSFELNKVASLTYGDIVCDQIFEMIEEIVAQPMNHTPLSVQKALVVTKHVLVYGSEKCVNHGYGIGKFVEQLKDFNTVLAAYQQKGVMAMWQRLQGGGVDRGGPVRQAAAEVLQLLSSIDELQRIRNNKADPNSLVPLGDDKVAFVTDEVRHYLLKQRIAEQQKIQIKSNLAKSEGGFGGGYMSRDGKSVVGAAHGIEEMMKIAQKGKPKYSDDERTQVSPDDAIFAELMAATAPPAEEVDLLSGGSVAVAPSQPSAEVDLLDFGSQTVASASASAGATGDLFGSSGLLATTPNLQADPFGLIGGVTSATNVLGGPIGGDDPFSLISPVAPGTSISVGADPFGLAMALPTPAPASATPLSDVLGSASSSTSLPEAVLSQEAGATLSFDGMVSGVDSMMITAGNQESKKKQPVMGCNEDRFAALDILAPSAPKQTKSLTATNAESRLLSFTSSSLDKLKPEPPPDTGGSTLHFGMNGTSLYDTQSPSSSLIGNLSAPPVSAPPPPLSPPPTPLMGMPQAVNNSVEYPIVAPGTGPLAASYVVGDIEPEDQDNPFVMGGKAGSGLEPVVPAPGAPPPPPP